MRIIIVLFCLLISFSADAQRRKKKEQRAAQMMTITLLSQLGRTIHNFEVPATASNKINGNYEWRFVLAEDNLRGKVTKSTAEQLTAFLFSFQPNTRQYKGEVLRAKEGQDKNVILAMIHQQLEQNIRYYQGDLDFVRIDGQYFYVLYFPYTKEELTKS